MSTHLDPNLAEKIVHEVKFQGVFDEFRKDSIADVDTKPAYLNLRQRVENAVQKFLSEQRWNPDTNKYQLRDRLRRHISESGFLDVGVERIVDQVVNPKIGSVFQPRIEEIAYKYLGLPPPAKLEHSQMPMPPFPNGNALKIETVQNEKENLLPKDLEQVSPDSDKTAVLEDDKVDDEEDESPPFEPITECKSPIKTEKDEPNDIKNEVKTELEDKNIDKEFEVKIERKCSTEFEPTITPSKDEFPSVDELASQESQLSQVSSDTASNQLNQTGSDPPTNSQNAATANISEEAQMPKFNENSTETEDNSKKISDLHFDIKKDEIKFEGTERKPNLLDGEPNESNNEEPSIMDNKFNPVEVEAKSAFNFTKLVKVETCNTQEAISSVSSQDDTSSAQLCIVEKSEQELLQADTNSFQKALPDESNALSLNNSQTKTNDNKRKSKSSSSTTSSRHKKSSKSSRRSPERSHRSHEDREQRDRSSKQNDRNSDNRHSSKHHYSSTEKNSSSSKRDEKRSSSSRSESQSRNNSSKRDYRDKHDSSKYRSHKIHRSDKDTYKSRKSTTADDHHVFKEKMRNRKSTDSNDEDKSPGAPNGAANSANQTTKTTTEGASTTTNSTGNTKSTHNETTKHSKDNKQKSASNNVSSSMVVVVNQILTNPSIGFVELETKPKVNDAMQPTYNVSADEEGELFYFEKHETDLKQRLGFLDEAISRCNFAYKALNQRQQIQMQSTSDCVVNLTENNNIINDKEMKQKTKATLHVDCYQYANNEELNQCSSINELMTSDTEALSSAAKRFKFANTDSGMSKENEMNEKNAIKTDIDAKTPSAPKRVHTIAKQRYTSEDLYKPRPILCQRIKRRGLDA